MLYYGVKLSLETAGSTPDQDSVHASADQRFRIVEVTIRMNYGNYPFHQELRPWVIMAKVIIRDKNK